MMYDVDAANSALLCEIIFRAEVIVFTIPCIISCNSSALFSRSLSKTIQALSEWYLLYCKAYILE